MTSQVLAVLDRANMVDASKTGIVGTWLLALKDLPADAVKAATEALVREGLPNGRARAQPADVRRRALAARSLVPVQFRCPDHPRPDTYLVDCPDCKRRIAPPSREVRAFIDQIREKARQSKADNARSGPETGSGATKAPNPVPVATNALKSRESGPERFRGAA
ncbi:hypothetical protein KRX56_06200 [Dermabacteraceae bacterium TAE3-ERU27]|nr:hypothetical protein [Dermabacteraceae bacterium TAE3-ERU27]